MAEIYYCVTEAVFGYVLETNDFMPFYQLRLRSYRNQAQFLQTEIRFLR